MPYWLDIWDGNPPLKVFSIRWGEDGTVKLVSFRRGPWIDTVLAWETNAP